MEWGKSLLSYITSGVNLNHPEILLIILPLTIVNEIGFPLFFALEIMRDIAAGIEDKGERPRQCLPHQTENMIRYGPGKISKMAKVTADKGKIGLFPLDTLDLRNPVNRPDLCDVASQSIDRIRGIYH